MLHLPRAAKFSRVLIVLALLLAVGIPLSMLAVYEMKQAEGSGHQLSASFEAREHEVEFRAVYYVPVARLDEFKKMPRVQRDSFVRYDIMPLMEYVFGPLVEMNVGGPQRVHSVDVDWVNMRAKGEWAEIPYTYKGVWLVSRLVSGQGGFDLPVPYNEALQFTEGWKRCTDSAPDHQTRSFYWYFWYPQRPGCDLQEGVHYQTVRVQLGKQTPNLTDTRPENDRLREDGELSMTIAFGYVEDPDQPNPRRNSNSGVAEYRKFMSVFEKSYGQGFEKEPIRLADYPRTDGENIEIGSRYTGVVGGLKVKVNVVVAASIDQMELFAKSFSHDNDDVFMWFGHSRVGSGFDAERFSSMLSEYPDYYRVTGKYQVIYWGGCNSYSYYTLPFFDLKAALDPARDPKGTRDLDIIANGMPSFFSLNARNAMIATRFFLEPGTTYFDLTKLIENEAKRMGATVLVTVMGDEDNNG